VTQELTMPIALAQVIRPGDRLVIGTTANITAAQAADLKAQVAARLDGAEVVVIGNVTAFAVYRDQGPFAPWDIADQAIGLFLEYRDQHGHDEQSARAAAALEVSQGVQVTDADLGARP
jgi:curli biogenesis system outer membrane secretion channel CsgG